MSESEQWHGGELGITHHANRQEPIETHEGEDKETGGEDTVHLALGVVWKPFAPVLERLTLAKQAAIASHEPVRARLGPLLVAVFPKGKKSGGGKGMYYAFSVRAQGFILWIAEHESPVNQTPNVLVEMGSTLLLSTRGLGPAWVELVGLLKDLNGTIVWDKISRIDLCADLPGLDAHDLIELVHQGQAVSRARKEQYHRESERWHGLQVGKGDVLVRIYDKVREVTVAKPDPVKRDLLERFRWGGPQTTALRVEFQLRREGVKSLGIGNVESYLANRGKLVAYLCGSWFRLVDGLPDRENNNTQRVETHPLWELVAIAFESWAGKDVPLVRGSRRPLHRDPIRLVKQGFGCLLAAVSELREGADIDPNEFLDLGRQCMEWQLDRMGEVEFYKRYHGKTLSLDTERGPNENH